MIFSRQIFLRTTKDETLRLLQSYVSQIRPPRRGNVTDNRFQIILTGRHNRSHWGDRIILSYVLAGSVRQKKSESTIDYSIYPGITNILIGGCLFFGVLSSIHHLLSGTNNHRVVGTLSCAFVLFFLWNIWEARECAMEFERLIISKTAQE